MSKSLAKEIALTNLAYCRAQGKQFQITRPHNVRLIEKHIAQLTENEYYKAAFVAFMIQKLQPFGFGNTQTAAIVAIQQLNVVQKKYDLIQLVSVIEKGAPVHIIQSVLEGKA